MCHHLTHGDRGRASRWSAPHAGRHACVGVNSFCAVRRFLWSLIVLLTVLGAAGACTAGGDGGSAPTGSAGGGSSKPKVVVTTDILGDVTRNILGDQVDVEILIPNSLPARNFTPAATDVNLLMGAQLIVAVGLGLEPGLAPALGEARTKGVTVLEVGPSLNPIPLGGSEANARAGVTTAPGSSASTSAPSVAAPDPHIWMDPDRMKQAMKLIGDAAEKLTGVDASAVRSQIADYTAKIDKADEEIQSTLAPIPDTHRRVVTVRDDLAYFADRYGFTIVRVAIPANRENPDAPIDPAELLSIASVVVDQQAYAVIADALPQSLADANDIATAVAAAPNTAVPVVVALDLEALGAPGSGAETYLGQLTTNAHTLAKALA
jgi:zinc/manganese transport system substrate-binding protein